MGISADAIWKLAEVLNKEINVRSDISNAVVTRIEKDGKAWVRLDGATSETPVNGGTQVTINPNDDVIVTVKNGVCTITNNRSHPNATTSDVGVVVGTVQFLSETVMDKASIQDLNAINGTIQYLEVDTAKIHNLTADQLTATVSFIDELKLNEVTAEKVTAGVGFYDELNANDVYATNITATVGFYDDLTANNVDAQKVTATTGFYDDLTANNVDATTVTSAVGYFGDLYANNITTEDIEAATGYIADLTADNVTASDIQAATAFVGDLDADNVTAADIAANKATIDSLDSNYAHITNGTIDNANISYANVNNLNAHYAGIDLANVNNAWINNGVIDTAAIVDEQVFTVTGNKATITEINADQITVRNLRATNLTVETADGYVTIGNKRTPTKEFIDSLVDDIQDKIDSTVETYTSSAVPLTTNYPANQWTTDAERLTHVGDICFVTNSSSDNNGFCYRYAYDATNQTFSWVLIKDNDVTRALSDISDLLTFESETSDWIDETDEGLRTIRSNHTTLSGIVDKTVKASTQLWFTKANTTAPTAPTAQVTTNNPSTANAWNLAVPTYNATYPNYFYCWQYQYVDNTYGWSAVIRDVATGESQERARTAITNAAAADTKAGNAQTTANTNIKSSVMLWYTSNSTTPPSVPTARVTSTATTSNTWTNVVPSYSASAPYYHYCYQQQLGNNNWQWTTPTYDDATSTAMKKAQEALPSSTFSTFQTTTFKELVDEVDEQSSTITTLSETTEGLSTDFANLQVGGQNLARKNCLAGGFNGATAIFDDATNTYTVVNPASNSSTWGSGVGFKSTPQIAVPYGSYYTASLDVMTPVEATFVVDINNHPVGVSDWSGNDNDETTKRFTGGSNAGRTGGISFTIPANTWTRIYWGSCNSNESNTSKVPIYVVDNLGYSSERNSVTWYIKNPQVQLGNKPTDWTPAPEDMATSASVTTVSNTVNSVRQTADSNSSKITNLTTVLGTNADGTTSATDVVHRTSSLEQDLSGFKTTVSETYATKALTNPNLVSYFQTSLNDTSYWNNVHARNNSRTDTEGLHAAYNATDYNDGIGWAHITLDSRASAGNTNRTCYMNVHLAAGVLRNFVKPNGKYTWVVEIKDLTYVGSNGLVVRPSIGDATLDVFSNVSNKNITQDGIYYSVVTAKSDFSALQERDTRGFYYIPPECYADFYTRVSLFEGEYTGTWKPYVPVNQVNSLGERVTTAETSITQNANAITLKANASDTYTKAEANAILEVKANKDTLTSEINASADTVKIDATKVNIEGAAIFTNGRLSTTSLNNAYDSKGSAANVQNNLNNLKIGSRNYLLDSANERSVTYANNTNGFRDYPFSSILKTLDDRVYTISFDAKASVEGMEFDAYFRSSSGTPMTSPSSNIWWLTTDYKRYSATITVSSGYTNADLEIFRFRTQGPAAGTITIKNCKLEVGNKPTDWTPAPEDQTAYVDSSIDGINVGGRNLMRNTAKLASGTIYLGGATFSTGSDSRVPTGQYCQLLSNNDDTAGAHFDIGTVLGNYNAKMITGETYTFSAWVLHSNGGTLSSFGPEATSSETFYSFSPSAIEADVWTLVQKKFVFNPSARYVSCCIYFSDTKIKNGQYMRVSSFKLEKGNKATDWSPAPEDIDNNANNREQTIYRSAADGTTSMSANTTWVTASGDTQNAWTTRRPTYDRAYPVLFVAYQRQTVAQSTGTTCSCTTPAIDTTTTVIDGGRIITGSVTANKLNASDINASNMLTIGSLSSDTQSGILNSEVSVGGRNLVLDTGKNVITNTTATTSFVVAPLYGTLSGSDYPTYPTLTDIGFSAGDKVTMSFDWKLSKYGENDIVYGNFRIEFYGRKGTSENTYITYFDKAPIVTMSASNTSGHYEGTVALTNDTVLAKRFVVRIDNSALTLTIRNFKLERGNKATDWSPALEDIESNAVKRTQRIYYRSNVNAKPTAMPAAWVTETGNKYNSNATTTAGWSTKVTPVTSSVESTVKYLYLWTCEQREMANGTLAYTNVLLDDSTTIIDGGNIITGTVTANKLNATNINSSGLLTVGSMAQATQSSILNSNIEVGGANRVPFSANLKTNEYPCTTAASWTTFTEDGITGIKCSGTDAAWYEWHYMCTIDPKQENLNGKQVVFSCEIRSSNLTDIAAQYALNFGCFGGNAETVRSRVYEIAQTPFSDTSTYHYTIVNDEWVRIYRVFDVPTTWTYTAQPYYNYGIQVKHINIASPAHTLYLRKPKLEIGNKPTDWSPNSRDVDSELANRMKMQVITTAGDFNNYKTTGIYYFRVASNTNAPVTNQGKLTVNFDLGTPNQIFEPDNLSYYYKRTYSSSTWSAWTKVDAVGAQSTADTANNKFVAFRGTCSTAAGTAAKVVSCTGFALTQGYSISVYNTTAQTVAGALTLNVNSLGAKNIYVAGAVTSDTNRLYWSAGSTVTFVYDGTQFRVADNPGSLFGSTCSDAETTAAKNTVVNDAVIFKGTSITVPMTNTNTAASPTLNVSSLGACYIYYGTSTIGPTKANGYAWPAGAEVICTFDGKFWRTGNQTFINGGNILTGTVTADKLEANSITIGKIKEETQASILNSNVKVGGRNYLLNSTVEKSMTYVDGNAFSNVGYSAVLPSLSDRVYTISVDAKASVSGVHLDAYFRTESGAAFTTPESNIWTLTTSYARYSATITIKDGFTAADLRLFRFRTQGPAGTVTFKNYKLEVGNKATDWTPAPEDQTAYVDSSVDNISVGGRNLLLKTGTTHTQTMPAINAGGYTTVDPYNMTKAYSALGLTTSDHLTISFDWTVTNAPANATVMVGTNASPWEYFGNVITFAAGSSGGHVSKSFKVTSALASCAGSKLRYRIDAVGNAITTSMVFTMSNVKLEKGNKATDWTPAPEDVDSSVSDAAKTATNYITYSNATDGIKVSYNGTNAATQITSSGVNIINSSNVNVASFGTVTRLGEANKTRAEFDYHSMQLLDKNGDAYFHVSDLRGSDGYATLTEKFKGDGNTKSFQVSFDASSTVSVTDSSNSSNTYSYTSLTRTYMFNTAPSSNATVTIVYKTESSFAKAYTLGYREYTSDDSVGGLSVAEGYRVTSSGFTSHAEGMLTEATASSSHAEGSITNATGAGAHAEGGSTTASGSYSHAEGNETTASGKYSHAEGNATKATGSVSHAEGFATEAVGDYSHVEGYYSTTSTAGAYSHAEGASTKAQNLAAHAEGSGTTASGLYSHAEGGNTTASSNCSHAEGAGSTASGLGAHAEGYYAYATNDYAHAEGYLTIASGMYSHAEGIQTKAIGQNQHASGTYNVANSSHLVIVGKGTSTSNRADAMYLSSTGALWIAGSLTQNSDRRLKTHHKYLGKDASDFIRKLKPALFTKDGERHLGFYAQDVQAAEPENWDTVTVKPDHTDESLDFDPLTLDYTALIAPLTAYTQELERRIEYLEATVDALVESNEKLKEMIDSI